MDTVLFAAFAVGYVVLLLWGVRMAGNGPAAANVLLPVIVALAYDNVMLAAGRFIGEGALLETLSGARYWLHAFLTPLLVIFAWNAAARTGWAPARQRWAPFVAAALYAVLVVADLLTEIRGLALEPEWEYGVLSYSSTAPASGPPVMILGVTLALLVASVIVLWKQRWPWFLVGTVLMGVGGSVALPIESAAITNAFEFILLVSLLATKQHQDRLDRRAGTAADAARGRNPVPAWG